MGKAKKSLHTPQYEVFEEGKSKEKVLKPERAVTLQREYLFYIFVRVISYSSSNFPNSGLVSKNKKKSLPAFEYEIKGKYRKQKKGFFFIFFVYLCVK